MGANMVPFKPFLLMFILSPTHFHVFNFCQSISEFGTYRLNIKKRWNTSDRQASVRKEVQSFIPMKNIQMIILIR